VSVFKLGDLRGVGFLVKITLIGLVCKLRVHGVDDTIQPVDRKSLAVHVFGRDGFGYAGARQIHSAAAAQSMVRKVPASLASPMALFHSSRKSLMRRPLR
jgi:hypothetical protein